MAILAAPLWGQRAAQTSDLTMGVAVPGATESNVLTGKPEPSLGPFGTESAPRRLATGIDATSLIRLSPTTEYMVTPGDLYQFDIIHYSGAVAEAEHLNVTVPLEEDYTVYLPLTGLMDARGMTFSELRKAALARLRAAARVQHVDMWITSPALFTVFVTGAVAQPGSIAAHGLLRVSDALDRAGGVLPGASWRRVALRRAGVVSTVDLLLWAAGKGEQHNPVLRPGDTVGVAITQTGVRIRGRVRYPGLYELVPGETLSDLLDLSGGVLSDADLGALTVSRIDATGEYVLLGVDLLRTPTFDVRDGDIVSLRSKAENAPMILVQGALFGQASDPTSPVPVPLSPISVQLPYTGGLTLLEVLDRLGGPTPYAESGRGYIERVSTGARIAFDARSLWDNRGSSEDVPLLANDRVVVPMRPLNVAVLGEVRAPGVQPFSPGATVIDYVRAAGGIVDGRGNLRGIRLEDRDGRARKAGSLDEPAPGETILVGKMAAAAFADFFGQNVFTITGVILGVAAIAVQVVEFLNLVGVTIDLQPNTTTTGS